MELFRVGFITVTFTDIIDITLVWWFLYKIYQIMRGTIAIQMFVGLFFIFIATFLVQAFNLSGLGWFVEQMRTVFVVVFVILFQPELRRALTYFGHNPLIRRFIGFRGVEAFGEIVKATVELSQKRYGALIVIVRDVGIKTVVETGLALQSKLSKALLISIFNPRSPLHDGAVIIHEDRIEAAKCLLPLSQNPQIDSDMGTRHRAAIGLSEESDAIVIVISEETGRISVAEGGSIVKGLNEKSLTKYLNDAFVYGLKQKEEI